MGAHSNRVLFAVGAFAVLLFGGCPTSSTGLDLSADGVLELVISRISGSSLATATAVVTENTLLAITSSKIALADDQVISVNSVPLTETTKSALGLDAAVDATIEAVDEPDEYTISFDNQGEVTTVDALPPADFDDISPERETEVTRDGFELTWDPAGDDDATINVTITGLVATAAADGSPQVIEFDVPLEGLADDGELTIGSAQLFGFLTGSINVRVTRVKSISRNLGFADGEIRFEIAKVVPLRLVDVTAATAE